MPGTGSLNEGRGSANPHAIDQFTNNYLPNIKSRNHANNGLYGAPGRTHNPLLNNNPNSSGNNSFHGGIIGVKSRQFAAGNNAISQSTNDLG